MHLYKGLLLLLTAWLVPVLAFAEPAPTINAQQISNQTLLVTIEPKVKLKKRTRVIVVRAIGESNKFRSYLTFVINDSKAIQFTEQVSDNISKLSYRARLRGASHSRWSTEVKVQLNKTDSDNDEGDDSTPDYQPENPARPKVPSVELPAGTTECPRSEVLKVYEIVNSVRSSNGLNPVSEHPALAISSQLFAVKVARNKILSHDGWYENILASGYKGTSAGQNLAYSGKLSATEIMNSWMNSSGHRDNIITPEFVDLGVGCLIDPQGIVWWTQDFGG